MNIFETLKTEMFLALTFPLILISTELFTSTWPSEYFCIQILAVWICKLNLNNENLLWQITVCHYWHYGCPGVLDSQNVWNSYVCIKWTFGIRREILRNSFKLYPAEKIKKELTAFISFEIRSEISSRYHPNWTEKAYQNMALPNMCFTHENLTVAQFPIHTYL
jgi:hypothetical protein